MAPIHPAAVSYLGFPGYLLTWLLFLSGISLFSYIVYKRYRLIRSGNPDPRFALIGERVRSLLIFGFIQKRQPRYLVAGLIHLTIFWGFLVLSLHSMDLLVQGLFPGSFIKWGEGTTYGSVRDIFELVVLGACVWAILRRAIWKPPRYGGANHSEAYLILGLIAVLMITDMFFEGSAMPFSNSDGIWLPAGRLAAFLLPENGAEIRVVIQRMSYWLHLAVFFLFLNLLPFSKHFHIITALPNIFFRKLTKGSIKPARWDMPRIEAIESLGVKETADFTWKQMLDLFTCTECGRCTDQCPAHAVGRPLSPMMINIKLREAAYQGHPVFRSGNRSHGGKHLPPMVGGAIQEDELWSCSTCGACEEECPVLIEHIDKIVDMRRHLVETSENPKRFSQVFINVEKTGNPFGKSPANRAEWIKTAGGPAVKVLREGDEVDLLFFVDSYGSYDPRAQEMVTAMATGLNLGGVDFGILGPCERDSGHQVRRMGEEGLFQLLVRENTENFRRIRFQRIMTADPHAYNTLKKDYPDVFEVCHYSEIFLDLIVSGRLKPIRALSGNEIYTYHDPCYLGRHNEMYDVPRRLIEALPGMRLVEMKKCRDRSFCCGGGDVILWHEIQQEEMRMAEKRIQMAKDAGATIVITACPFCLIHFEDAVKTMGLEKEMKIVDLMELTLSTL